MPRSAHAIAILLTLAGAARATPIKLKPIGVTASGSYGGMGPNLAIDGDTSTYWNSGGWPSQWIMVDLGRPMPVSKVSIEFAPNPGGAQTGTVAFDSGQTYSWNQNVYDTTTIDFAGDVGSYHGGNVRYITVTTTSSTSWVAIREISVYGGVEYFGYFRDSAYDVGSAACQSTGSCDYMSETSAAGANMVWIGASSTTDLDNRLLEAEERGVKAMVDLQYFFWVNRTTLVLTNWSAVQTVLARHTSAIAGFYLYDEPDYAGVRATDLRTLHDQVHQYFPSIPTAAIFTGGYAASATDSSLFSVPEWVGFDYYAKWTGNGTGHYSIPDLITRLRSFLRSDQRMIAVPASEAGAWVENGYVAFGDKSAATMENEIENNANDWQAQILSDGKYVAVVPYCWQSFGSITGARDLPWMKERMYQIENSFIPTSDTHLYPVSFSVSNSYGGSPDLPYAAFDGDTSTFWNSGGLPDQWILASFGGVSHITKVQLTAVQTPSGTTTHTLYGFVPVTGTWRPLHTWSGTTGNGTVFTWPGPGDATSADVSAVKMDTTQSPSWVAWSDVQIFRQ